VVIRAFGVLAGILDDAVSDRRIDANPIRHTKLPRKTRKPHIYLSHDEVWRFAEAAGDRGTLILVLAYTGLRWGEVTGLRVLDLDLLRKRIRVTQNAVRSGGSVYVGTPKSNRSRPVPIPRLLAAQLARQCEGKDRTDLVFPNLAGKYLRAGKWWSSAQRRAGIPPLSPHDLRHTAASLAVQAGANVKAVQAMLGHTSAAMTLDVYAELFGDELDLVADRLDEAAELSRVARTRPTAT
jgi:integrase